MGARQRDQRLAGAATDADDVTAQPVAVFVALPRHLLGGRDDTLGSLGLAAHSDDDQAAGVGASIALDDAADDVAFAGRELAVVLLVLGIAQPLQDHLTRGGRRDAAETLWRVVPFGDDVAVLVGFARQHLDHAGLAVDLDACVGLVPLGVAVRSQQCRLDCFDDHVDRNSFVSLDRVQCRHVDVHRGSPFPDWPASSSSR